MSRQLAYYERNKERILAQQRERYHANREQILAQQREKRAAAKDDGKAARLAAIRAERTARQQRAMGIET